MPQYEYECPEHGRWLIEFSMKATLPTEVKCDFPDCGQWSKRIYSFKMQPVMQSHYNVTTESMISDSKQFERELKEKGDRLTERTGIAHDFAPLSPSEMKDANSLGVNDAGMDATRKRQRAVE